MLTVSERCRRGVMMKALDCEGIEHNQSVTLDQIYDYYKKALDRLPPELFRSLLEGGFCFGFLDPVSNIIANTVSQDLDNTFSEELYKGKKRKRSRAGTTTDTKKGKNIKSELERQRDNTISAIITESNKDISLIPRLWDSTDTELRNSSIAARSLRGLVAFLTSYFRHLTAWDALRYLRLSKADLLVAVHLIKKDHGTYNFDVHDSTTKIALGCAAISAMHPAVATFVSRSFSLASHVDEVSILLAAQYRISHNARKRLSELFTPTKDVINQCHPLQHAISRMQHINMETIPVGLEISLKMVLLDKIHLLYLKAISSIPKHELCSRLHRGLLKAGHCYGPFDPVANIILNTIWYDTMFPPKKGFEAEMICTKSLARIEVLSLCGLVAYICVRYPALSVYEAMKHLLICDARLDKAIAMAQRSDQNIHFSYSDAYDMASRAARHPSPTAFVEFATTVTPEVGYTLCSTLDLKGMLSSSDVRTISRTISRKFQSSKSLEPVQKLSKHASKIISANCSKLVSHQSTIVKRVKAALRRYAREEGQEYELHVICDVNSAIPEHGVCYCPYSYKYPFSHMNIWARRKGPPNGDADQVHTLFFIECSNSDVDMQDMPYLCCPIFDLSNDAGRCYHCEHKGIKVIHPSSEVYHGQCKEFEDMARGRSSVNNLELNEYGQMSILFDRALEDEDYIF